MEDLFNALKMFQSGVQQAATTVAVDDATQAMNQIKNNVTDQADQRRQLQALSDNLALRMVGAGASAEHIAQAFKAVAPQTFATPEQAITEGTLSGRTGLTELGSKAQDIVFNKELKKFAAQEAIKEKSDERKFQREYGMAILKSSLEEGKKTKMTADELEKLTNLDIGLDLNTDIMSKIGSSRWATGTIGSRIPDIMSPENAALRAELGRAFDAYRIAVTGAGASPGEIEMLQKNMPNITDNVDVIKEKLSLNDKLMQSMRIRRIGNLGLAGRDVSNFVARRRQEAAVEAEQQAKQGYIQNYVIKGR